MTALPDARKPAADAAVAVDSQHPLDTDDRYTVAAMLDLLAEENLPFLMRRQVA
jgi:hypothetical protein